MKKITGIITTLAIVCCMSTVAFASEPALISGTPSYLSEQSGSDYTIQINGETIDADVCVMVPLRAIAEKLGFTVTWKNGTVLVDDGTMHTNVTIGTDRYLVSTSIEGVIGTSAPFSLGAAPYVTNGVTYVPVELFDAMLGSQANTIVYDGNTIIIKDQAKDNTQIPSPFVTCTSLKEAAQKAGFSLSVPDMEKDYPDCTISVISEKMIEASYKNKDEQEISIRKAAGSEDISGDYTQYDEVQTISVGNASVTLKGTDGKTSLAVWNSGDYAYSIGIYGGSGISGEEMAKLVAAVK